MLSEEVSSSCCCVGEGGGVELERGRACGEVGGVRARAGGAGGAGDCVRDRRVVAMVCKFSIPLSTSYDPRPLNRMGAGLAPPGTPAS